MAYRGGVKKKFIASLALTGLVLSACAGGTTFSELGGEKQTADPEKQTADPSSQPSSAGITPIDAPMPQIPQGLEEFYEQDVEFSECGAGTDCANITVPLDYNNPSGDTIDIAVKRAKASGDAIGSLLVNPGGPGGSGQDMAEQASYYFGADILANFDVIGFDPRGVGGSAPVDCLDDAALAEVLEASYPDTPEGEAQSSADVEEVIAGCKARSGDLLPFVGTEEAARDMDVIRHVLGDPKLYYVGYSYGTKLGGMYSELFPENVGRVILDGAVDSSVSDFEESLAQLKGFELATDNYLKDCINNNSQCPFDGSVEEARSVIAGLFEDALENPLPTTDPNRPLTQAALLFGFVTPLYDDTSWSYLTMALDETINQGSGTLFQMFFDMYTSRQPDGSFADNSTEANWAINCADSVLDGDKEQWDKQEQQMKEEAPLFGPVMGYSQEMCAKWPVDDSREVIDTFHAVGSDPIVVVGTVGDPATPYEWAVNFEKTFENATLVTWEGEGHTAYGRAGECVNGALDQYLLNGTVPEEGLTCGADE